MTAPAAPLDRAVEEAREAHADARKIINKWIFSYKGTLESELAGHVVILSDAIRSLLAALDADKRLEDAEARLARIECYAGERCEASGCRFDPCGPVEYHDVEGVPLCAECWQECVDEAEDARREEKGENRESER